MNIADVFLNNNGQLNLNAIGVILTAIGVIVAIILPLRRDIQSGKNNKINQFHKEMEKLVAPLYSKKDDTYIFVKLQLHSQNRGREGYKDYSTFWENIERYKYLGPTELRSALDNYLESTDDGMSDESYQKAKTELVEVVENRYAELENVISKLGDKI
ncbi:hypothetical protein [Methanolobus sp. ZRKC5]|uniref:hypothetical protein n=1 Tax=unclassified Methanolobus TaxID=2629569 RepID=UPI00313C44F1